MRVINDELRCDGLPPVPGDVSFRDAGGDSVAAARIAERLQAELGLDVPLVRFFTDQPLDSLVRSIVEEGR